MHPGDLVRLYEAGRRDIDYIVGSFLSGVGGWAVPCGTLAVIIGAIPDLGHGLKYRVLVDGKMGWVYKDDCELVDETG